MNLSNRLDIESLFGVCQNNHDGQWPSCRQRLKTVVPLDDSWLESATVSWMGYDEFIFIIFFGLFGSRVS